MEKFKEFVLPHIVSYTIIFLCMCILNKDLNVLNWSIEPQILLIAVTVLISGVAIKQYPTKTNKNNEDI